jgi:hypothetical protein
METIPMLTQRWRLRFAHLLCKYATTHGACHYTWLLNAGWEEKKQNTFLALLSLKITFTTCRPDPLSMFNIVQVLTYLLTLTIGLYTCRSSTSKLGECVHTGQWYNHDSLPYSSMNKKKIGTISTLVRFLPWYDFVYPPYCAEPLLYPHCQLYPNLIL